MSHHAARPVVVVTGSTRGIGSAIARAHAEAGAFVVVHGRDTSSGLALARDLGGAFVGADLADPDGAHELADGVRAIVDRVDTLVNNAGFEIHGPLGALDPETLAAILTVNLTTPILLTQELLPLLESTRGSVQNVTSIHDQVPAFGNLAYPCAGWRRCCRWPTRKCR